MEGTPFYWIPPFLPLFSFNIFKLAKRNFRTKLKSLSIAFTLAIGQAILEIQNLCRPESLFFEVCYVCLLTIKIECNSTWNSWLLFSFIKVTMSLKRIHLIHSSIHNLNLCLFISYNPIFLRKNLVPENRGVQTLIFSPLYKARDGPETRTSL